MNGDKKKHEPTQEEAAAYCIGLLLTLETRSTKELMDFLVKWAKRGVLSPSIVAQYVVMDEKQRTATLCKMAYNIADITEETKEWARNWLVENDMALYLNLGKENQA